MTYNEEADAIINKLKYAPAKPILDRAYVSDVTPTAPMIGSLWLDTTTYIHKIYNGTMWVVFG